MNKFSGVVSATAMALLLVGCGDSSDMDDESMQDMQQEPMQQQENTGGMEGQPQDGGYESQGQESDQDQDW